MSKQLLLYQAIYDLFQSNPPAGLMQIKSLVAGGHRPDQENDEGKTPLSLTIQCMNDLLAAGDDPANALDFTEIQYKLHYLSQVHTCITAQ